MTSASPKKSHQSHPRPQAHGYSAGFFHKVNIALFSVFVLIGFYYLVSTNDLVVKGVIMQSMKSKIRNLDQDNQSYGSKVLALQSYGSLESRVKNLDMVAVGNVDYLTAKSPLPAMK